MYLRCLLLCKDSPLKKLVSAFGEPVNTGMRMFLKTVITCIIPS